MTRRIFASLLAAPFFRRFRKQPEVDFRIPIIVENRAAFRASFKPPIATRVEGFWDFDKNPAKRTDGYPICFPGPSLVVTYIDRENRVITVNGKHDIRPGDLLVLSNDGGWGVQLADIPYYRVPERS